MPKPKFAVIECDRVREKVGCRLIQFTPSGHVIGFPEGFGSQQRAVGRAQWNAETGAVEEFVEEEAKSYAGVLSASDDHRRMAVKFFGEEHVSICDGE